MRNPLRPVRLALLWLLSGISLENHTAAIQRIDDGHQQQLARLKAAAPATPETLVQPAPASRYDDWGSEVCAKWCVEQARRYPGANVAILSPTFTDGLCAIESGLLPVLEKPELAGGGLATAWSRALGELLLANGSVFKVAPSSQMPRPEYHFAWVRHPEAWSDVSLVRGVGGGIAAMRTGSELPARPGWDSEFSATSILDYAPPA